MPTVQVFSLPTFAQHSSLENTVASKETFHVLSTLSQESSFPSAFIQESNLIETEMPKDSFHVETSRDLSVSTFPCRMCDKTFASAKTRSQHKLNMHSTVSKNKTVLFFLTPEFQWSGSMCSGLTM